jgi:hypothetical protein
MESESKLKSKEWMNKIIEIIASIETGEVTGEMFKTLCDVEQEVQVHLHSSSKELVIYSHIFVLNSN